MLDNQVDGRQSAACDEASAVARNPHDERERQQHRQRELALRRLNRRGRQRPVAAGGMKALPGRPRRAKLDQVFEGLREEGDRGLRDQRNPGLVVLARPWRELGLRDAHGRYPPVVVRRNSPLRARAAASLASIA
jgi:hypothetical protein